MRASYKLTSRPCLLQPPPVAGSHLYLSAPHLHQHSLARSSLETNCRTVASSEQGASNMLHLQLSGTTDELNGPADVAHMQGQLRECSGTDSFNKEARACLQVVGWQLISLEKVLHLAVLPASFAHLHIIAHSS